MKIDSMNQLPRLQRLFGPLTILSIAISVPAFFIVRELRPELVLPAMSALLFASAAMTALFAFSTGAERNAETLTLWDMAGGLALTGCAAAILGEPDQVAHFFDQMFERKSQAK